MRRRRRRGMLDTAGPLTRLQEGPLFSSSSNRSTFAPGWVGWLVPFVLVVAVFAGIILYAHGCNDGRPLPVYSAERVGTDLLAVERGHPCPERVLLACERRVAAGWPGCSLVPLGTPGAALVTVGPMPNGIDEHHAAGLGKDSAGRWVIRHEESACRPNDCTIEHESGHLVPVPCKDWSPGCTWDDDDFAGSVMNRAVLGRERLTLDERIEGTAPQLLGGMGCRFPRPPQPPPGEVAP